MDRLETGYQQRGCPVKTQEARKVGPATYCGPAGLFREVVGPFWRRRPYARTTVAAMRAAGWGGDDAA